MSSRGNDSEFNARMNSHTKLRGILILLNPFPILRDKGAEMVPFVPLRYPLDF